jgi:hypothetical protein
MGNINSQLRSSLLKMLVSSSPPSRLGGSSSSISSGDTDHSNGGCFSHSDESSEDDISPPVADGEGEEDFTVVVNMDPGEYIVIEDYLVVPFGSFESNSLL